MVRAALLLALVSAGSVSLDYSKCDFFVSGTISEGQVCAGRPPEPNDGFMVFFDGRSCDDDAWGRPRLDFLTEYVVDPDISPAAAVQHACGERRPLPSDIRLDAAHFSVCRGSDYRGMTHLRFVAVLQLHDEVDPVLRQLSFDLYAMPGDVPIYLQRAKRLASELHFDLGGCK